MYIHKALLYKNMSSINDFSKVILGFPKRYSHYKNKSNNLWQILNVKQINDKHFVIVLNDPHFEKPRGRYNDNILIHISLLPENYFVLIKVFLKWPVWKKNLIIIQDLLAFIFLVLPICLDINVLSWIVFIIFPVYVVFYHLSNFSHNRKTLRTMIEILEEEGCKQSGDGYMIDTENQ